MATEVQNIRDIMDTSLIDAEITPYITAAEITLSEVLGSYNLPTEQYDMIVAWYTAHLIAITKDRQAAKEKAGSADITYAGDFGMNLDASTYGQMVKVIDPTGELAKSHKMKATVFAVKSFKNSRRITQ